ncbi:hypothetical protein KI688_000766 [Linnemannia hyalina]|uniref:F-box domain-containing protein n=1 Tax=Linnemannia hyalina TaxID=64524 RepID=A0A9P8BYD6_9FUNG|nr:hypothetical protein KI688_000766 [Linnemannia hyalina]
MHPDRILTILQRCQLTPGLEELRLCLKTVDEEILMTILSHAATLKTLDLSIARCDPPGVECIRLVLMAGQRLESFSLKVIRIVTESGVPKMTFKPKTVLSCLLVSKLWHQTLLPVLWHTYTCECMRRASREVLDRNSTYLRILDAHSELPSPIHCTNLAELSILQGVLDMSAQRQLVRTNSGLKVLRWHGPYRKVPLNPQDFVHLKRIQSLVISHWIGGNGELTRTLKAVAGSLVKLYLGWIEGMPKPSLAGEVSGGEWVDKKHTDDLVLPYLETFTSSCNWPNGPDPSDLVQSCPNLRSCDTILTGEIDVMRLSNTLMDCCPRLDNLTVRDYAQLHLGETLVRNLGGGGPRGPIHRLVSITVSQVLITKSLVSAILLHAPTLEYLTIMVQEVDVNGTEDSGITTAFLPLEGCRLLKSFSFCIWNRASRSATILEGLQQVQTWGCRGIEQLFLDFTPPEGEGKQEGSASVEDILKDGLDLGWTLCPKRPVITTSYVLKMKKGFFQDLFGAVQGLEQLRVAPDGHGNYDDEPRAIINCMLVSRQWYDVLVPILWHTYLSARITATPLQVLGHFLSHMRILQTNMLFPLVALQCNRLIELSIFMRTFP